ncbi:MAG TPA: Mut7-C RNAse domain-containing protein [Acidobacteriota bacterium]|nr:Mut7-C RNAse domain-containing protein [Acidobacteriota bacterium]HQP74615.1 Mut7-C RNAse domain-containing protein [Acidobacteriota bacterium]
MRGFLVDGMLGRLARWMRLLGLDAEFRPGLPDDELIELAVAADRILVTRDRRLAGRRAVRDRVILIAAERWPDQVAELLAGQPELGPIRPLTRCLRCNEPLVAVDAAEVVSAVPPYVSAHHREFRRCPSCGRIYWPGTHRDRMREMLRRLGLDPDPPPEAGSGETPPAPAPHREGNS